MTEHFVSGQNIQYKQIRNQLLIAIWVLAPLRSVSEWLRKLATASLPIAIDF